MKVVKLDKRYDGYGRFSHRVEFWGRNRDVNTRQWIQARNWLWTQFGPSAELFAARPAFFDGNQPKWAWDAEKSSLYLAQEAFTMFQLKKEFWENAENL